MLDKQCVEHYILISNSFFSLKILITPIAHCCAKYVECQIGDHLIAGQNTFEPLIVEHWIYVKKHSSDQKRCCSTVRSCTRWQSWHSDTAAAAAAAAVQCCVCRLIWFCVCFCDSDTAASAALCVLLTLVLHFASNMRLPVLCFGGVIFWRQHHWCLWYVLVVAFWRQHHCTLVVLQRHCNASWCACPVFWWN